MTRMEKNKYLHQLLKKESDEIKTIVETEKNNYKELFDEQMGNPMQQLEDMLPRVYRMEGKNANNR